MTPFAPRSSADLLNLFLVGLLCLLLYSSLLLLLLPELVLCPCGSFPEDKLIPFLAKNLIGGLLPGAEIGPPLFFGSLSSSLDLVLGTAAAPRACFAALAPFFSFSFSFACLFASVATLLSSTSP